MLFWPSVGGCCCGPYDELDLVSFLPLVFGEIEGFPF